LQSWKTLPTIKRCREDAGDVSVLSDVRLGSPLMATVFTGRQRRLRANKNAVGDLHVRIRGQVANAEYQTAFPRWDR